MYLVLGLPESPRRRSIDQLAIEDSEDEVNAGLSETANR
jgi:hypothetical protein